MGKRTFRNEIDAYPLPGVGGRIRIGLFRDGRDSYDGLFRDAVIEEDRISPFHCGQIVSCLEISDSGPGRSFVPHEVSPRVGRWFLFHEPVLHGDFLVDAPDIDQR